MKKLSVTKKKWYLIFVILNAIVFWPLSFTIHHIIGDSTISRIATILIYLLLSIIQIFTFGNYFEIEEL